MICFFIALLPSQHIQDYANQIKQRVAKQYSSYCAQNSPPHITLQPPFEWSNTDLALLEECLANFAGSRSSIPITLSGYGAFPPRVIYINVVRSPEILNLEADLIAYMENNLGIVNKVSKNRPFVPHMTVAFKDLTRQNFKAAWKEFQSQDIYFEFIAYNMTLLLHDSKKWNMKSEFPLLF